MVVLVVVLVAVLVLATAAGLLWKARTGRVRAPAHASLVPDLADVLAELGVTPGERATLLQFSSAFCAPCRATRTRLTHVAQQTPGVVHVEVDAEQRLDLVRRLDIRKTPTTLVLDGSARELGRAAGAPRMADVLAVLPPALPS